MDSTSTDSGTLSQGETPCWAPLERLLGNELCDHFMWMFDVELADGRRLNAYKNIWTRRYFHLDDLGRTYYYVGDHHYRKVAADVAIEVVLEDRAVYELSPDEEAALSAAISRGRGARD